MALQNIGEVNSNDAFYRYKMPKMMTKIEGRGNGIKTKIVNMLDIAKALGRPASYTTKYFGYELGAQSKFDERTSTSLVNGAHNTQQLAKLLNSFIEKYVLCRSCHNPETEILMTKNQMIQLKCAACGFLSDVDMRDKFTTFILKNPSVTVTKKGGATQKKPVKKETSNHKKSSKEKNKSGGSPSSDHEEDVQWQTDTSMEAAQKRIKEQLSDVTADMVLLEDYSRPPCKSKPGLVKDLKEYLNKGCSGSQLKSYLASCSSGIPAQEVVDALFESLFDGVHKSFAKEVDEKKKYIVAALGYAQGSQPVLLHGIESYCGKASPDAVKEVALALKVLYDADVLEEDAILAWYHRGLTSNDQGSPVWKHVRPFMEWLQSAESESE